jgi:hypothetical protein
MDAFQIIVIILATTLFIFLVLAIILLVQLIKISAKIRQITESISAAADSVRHLSDSFRRVLTPAVVGKTILGFVQKIWNNKGKERQNDKR